MPETRNARRRALSPSPASSTTAGPLRHCIPAPSTQDLQGYDLTTGLYPPHPHTPLASTSSRSPRPPRPARAAVRVAFLVHHHLLIRALFLPLRRKERAREREAAALKVRRILAWRAQFAPASPPSPVEPALPPPTVLAPPALCTSSPFVFQAEGSRTSPSASASPSPSIASHSPLRMQDDNDRDTPPRRPALLTPPSPTALARRHTSPPQRAPALVSPFPPYLIFLDRRRRGAPPRPLLERPQHQPAPKTRKRSHLSLASHSKARLDPRTPRPLFAFAQAPQRIRTARLVGLTAWTLTPLVTLSTVHTPPPPLAFARPSAAPHKHPLPLVLAFLGSVSAPPLLRAASSADLLYVSVDLCYLLGLSASTVLLLLCDAWPVHSRTQR
ncbi:hypothetical protein FB451DRAFT_1393500 [Mycena latifolia]|nr:hypothetical protein FB451DRAFT_1393500 [Mycena latifolia]